MEATVRDIEEVWNRRRHVIVVQGDDPETKGVGICHQFSSNLRKYPQRNEEEGLWIWGRLEEIGQPTYLAQTKFAVSFLKSLSITLPFIIFRLSPQNTETTSLIHEVLLTFKPPAKLNKFLEEILN